DRATESLSLPMSMDKMVKLPFVEMTGGIALNIAIFHIATHACDLTRATGQHDTDAELLAGALAIGQQMVGPDMRVPGVFGNEQAADAKASAEDKLLTFAGRKV